MGFYTLFTLYRHFTERKITMEDLLAKWEEALEIISETVEYHTFSTFIKPIIPMELRENELIFKVELKFSLASLKITYMSTIADALFKVFKFPVTPVFQLADEYEKYLVNRPQVPLEENKTDFGLSPSLTFDNFVVGSSNRMAHAASLAVADMPGDAYNPLYLYGHSGLGKTHLMNAIGNHALGRNPFSKILYVTSEAFTTELIDAIRTGTTSDFREKYRSLDILMIDDIQFIAGKAQTEEEFFHTFNELSKAGKQIVISGDRPPSEMVKLEERIRFRLIENLICEILPPDYETRMAILKNRCLAENIELPDYILEYIAENVVNNIRELKGALSTLKMYASFNHITEFNQKTLPQKDLESILNPIIAPVVRYFTIEQIIEKVSEYYDIPVAEILSSKHHKEINLARQVAMFISRQLTNKPLKEIGKSFNRDYTTVINALNRMEKNMMLDASIKDSVNTITYSLKESNY